MYLKTRHNIGSTPPLTFTQRTETKGKLISTLPKQQREQNIKDNINIVLQENYINENAEETAHIVATYKELRNRQTEAVKRKLAYKERVEDIQRKVKGIALAIKYIDGELTVIVFYRRQQQDGKDIIIVLREQDGNHTLHHHMSP